jgi:4-hydroxybenzoate polyprenyltransferase
MYFKNILFFFLLSNFNLITYSYFNKFNTVNICNKRKDNKFDIYNKIDNYNIFNKNNKFQIINNSYFFNKLSNKLTIINKKKINFMKLIRGNNIIPTILLHSVGSYIINPSINNLLKSKEFIVSLINSLFIMSSAMIINDIVDIEIDKINSSDKPLVNNSISIKEAYSYLFILLGISQILSFNYLPKNMQILNNISTFNILIYTSILKKITFIKNISCAFLVSFTIIFYGLSNTINIDIYKYLLLFVLSNTIFFGSFYNEVLLDIRDIEGDKKYNIRTIPVKYGHIFSINLLYSIIKTIMIINTLFLIRLYNFKISFIYTIICSLLLNNLKIIKKSNYSKRIIIEIVKDTNKILILLLGYFIFIAKLYTYNIFSNKLMI